MSPVDRLDQSVQRIQAAFDLPVERFDKDSSWRRHLPATWLEIAGLMAQTSKALGDIDKLGTENDDSAHLRTRLPAFRTNYANHQVYFLTSSTNNAEDYRMSLRTVLEAFSDFAAAVQPAVAKKR